MKRVGYWLNEEKSKKPNFKGCLELFRNADIQLIKLDMETPFEGQGPFDMILHKFIDVQFLSQLGKRKEHRYMRNIEDFISRHPDCIIVNPLDRLQQFLDRARLFRTVQECCDENTGTGVFVPPFADLTSNDVNENRAKLIGANVRCPFVCEPVYVPSTEDGHCITIVFLEDGVCPVTVPCVAHQFIKHDANMYKVFKIGRKQHVIRQPSPHHHTLLWDVRSLGDESAPETSKLDVFCEALRQKLGVDMFCVDVIVERDSQRYAVIDVNFFPGYNGIKTFYADLLEYLKYLLSQHKQERPPAEMP